jgi:hypothetical protein
LIAAASRSSLYQAGTLVSNSTWWETRYGRDSQLHANTTVAVQGNTVGVHSLPAPTLQPRWRTGAGEWVNGTTVTAEATLAASALHLAWRWEAAVAVSSTQAGSFELSVLPSGSLPTAVSVEVWPGVMSFQHCTFDAAPAEAASYVTALTLTPRDQYSNPLTTSGSSVLPIEYYVPPRYVFV